MKTFYLNLIFINFFILSNFCILSNCNLITEFKKTKIDSDGLISIHTDNLNDVVVYNNRVDVIRRTVINGSISSYTKHYYVEKSNEKIIASISIDSDITKDESLIIFTKSNTFCSIKTIRYFGFYNTHFQINRLCDLLNGIILIKFENGSEATNSDPFFRFGNYFIGSSKFIFYYKNYMIKYSLMNNVIEKFDSNIFEKLSTLLETSGYLYIKFISNYIIKFIFKDKTVEYNYNTLKLLQTINLENVNLSNWSTTFSLFTVATTTGSIFSIITILFIVLIKLNVFEKCFSKETTKTIYEQIKDVEIKLEEVDKEDQPVYNPTNN